MDLYKASMNPCSLESLSLSNGLCWPVIVSCYELETDGRSRRGHMDLFLVTRDLKFGQPHTITTDDDSGILDGKWKSPVSINGQHQQQQQHWFATARSSGQVRIDAFHFHETNHATNNFVSVQHVASSEPLQETPALCLSLNWDDNIGGPTTSIVSSYSNGKVAIHDVIPSEHNDAAHVVEKESWVAHSLFGHTPTEVWSACFAGSGSSNNNTMVLSGGDDTKLKIWDVRCTTKPMQVLQHFEAGVTCISMDPTNSNICAVGSYDETIALYDLRTASTPIVHSKPLGGGIWRIKWHPHHHNRLLVAAMHGGCRVGEFQEGGGEFLVTKEFTKHESMAYGADWLVSSCGAHDDDEDFVEAAASCSFYDRAVYLWDTR